mgnify:CR=1 FL=1
MISVLYNIILITNFKLIEMCIKSSPFGEGKGEGLVGGWIADGLLLVAFLSYLL